MAQTGYTPIYLYYSGTSTHVPLAADLGAGELAINAADGNLFYKNTSNAVVTVPLIQASSTKNGWLSSTDWNTFNNGSTGPAFSAYLGTTQTISNTTFTKLQASSEEFDTANCYDSSTNYRFTPNVAGYYQISGQIFINASTGITGNTLCSIYKNGSRFKDGNLVSGTLGTTMFTVVSALVYFNGSTDYVELYGLVTGTGTLVFAKDAGTSYQSYFQGALVRTA